MNTFKTKFHFLGLFLALVLFSCNSKEKYNLEYKLAEGDNFKQSMKIASTISQMGQKMQMDMDVSLLFDIKKLENDIYTVELSYEKIKMDMDMGMAKISFDSETDTEFATLEDMSPIFRAMTGVPMTIQMSKKGKVQSVNGFEKIVESMTQSIDAEIEEAVKDQILSQMQGQFSEEAVQSLFTNISSYFPQEDVAIGDSWVSQSTIDNNGMQMTSTLNLTLKNVEGNTAELICSGEVSTPEEGIIQNSNGMEVTVVMSGTTEGSIFIDLNTGITAKGDLVQKLTGKSTVMGMDIDQEIENNITIRN